MERRYLLDVNDPEIFIDTENNDQMLNAFEVKDILNEQDEKIKQLEEQLRLAKLGENFEQEKKNNACKLLNELNEKINKRNERIDDLLSKLRVSNSQLASCELEHNKLKLSFKQQEKLLGEKLASNSRLQLENQQLKQKLAKKEEELEYARYPVARILDDLNQLKQFQNSKAVAVLEELKKYFAMLDKETGAYDIIADYGDILDWIKDKITELRGDK